jgi:AraC family transcriptional regulator, transcriptional activator FtrA
VVAPGVPGAVLNDHVACPQHRLLAVVELQRDLARGDQKRVVPPGDDVIARSQQWMLTVLQENLSIRDMAEHVNMSERTFHRRFRERTGASPLSWLREQRIARAKELLENSGLPIEEIARQIGMGTPANLRTQFRRATNVSPREHRRLFAFGQAS